MPGPILAQRLSARVLIVGGGAAGLACAWRLSSQGARVTVLEAGCAGGGALWASGGMLAAGFESSFELEPDHALARPFAEFLHEGLIHWAEWAPQLSVFTDQPLGYEQKGSIAPAFEPTDLFRLDVAATLAEQLGVPATRVDAQTLASLEPHLTPGLGALIFAHDGQLDKRVLGGALAQAARQSGADIREGVRVDALDRTGGQVTGVVLAEGQILSADLVILASGAERLANVPLSAAMTPVKGQMISFSVPRSACPKRVVRGVSIYLAAKPGDRLIAGASVEPGHDNTSTDPDTLERLTEAARRVAPSLRAAPVTEGWAGLRPRSADGMPVAGEVGSGLYLALGGYRNGVLAAPGLAELILQALGVNPPGLFAKAFAPKRFNTLAEC